MKIALDPYMLRRTPLVELPAKITELGFEHIELSPREDFLPFFTHPRADRDTVASFKRALAAAGVSVSSVQPLYRWSGPGEEQRAAAVRYWKRAIEIGVDLGCTVMNSEFNGRPEQAEQSEGMFFKSMEEPSSPGKTVPTNPAASCAARSIGTSRHGSGSRKNAGGRGADHRAGRRGSLPAAGRVPLRDVTTFAKSLGGRPANVVVAAHRDPVDACLHFPTASRAHA